MSPMPLLPEAIDAWLPQTQCTRCGYPSCRAYAEAVTTGGADINQCPPGGDITIAALAALLDTAPKPLNPAYGQHLPRQRALIDEPACIGCRKCLEVCPVDAIVGARQHMHSVLDAECNGCALCLPVCPVDCIALLLAAPTTTDGAWPQYSQAEVSRWRTRTEARHARLQKAKFVRRTKKLSTPETEQERMRAEIRAAVSRVRAEKSARRKEST